MEKAFQVDVIYDCPDCPDDESLRTADRFFIWITGAVLSSFGYNMTSGGEGGARTPEMWARQRAWTLAYWASMTPTERKVRMMPLHNAPWTAERRAKLSRNLSIAFSGENHPSWGKNLPEGVRQN